jgi:hypothetical protein
VEAVGYSATTADVNGDGYLDIHVASYNRYDRVQPDSYFDATNGTPNRLFVNEGGKRFRELAGEVGVADRRWSFAAIFADVDGDGDQDLYVSNDFSANALYRNMYAQTGALRFIDSTTETGLQVRGYGMGASFGDYDNDGSLDLHATYMSSTAGNRILGRFDKADAAVHNVSAMKAMAAGNRLFRASAAGFTDVTDTAGPLQAQWAWGGGFLDFDNDGWADLHSANGMLSGKEMADT